MPTATAAHAIEMTIPALLARDVDGTFPALVSAYQDGIYSGVLRLVRTPADAEDITQETFLRAYRALQSYEPERIRSLALDGWLWTIALNLCRNAARGRTRRPAPAPLEAAPELAGRSDTAADAVEAVADATWQRRLETLTAPMRTAVVLRHVVGLTYAEIAEATGRPMGTVKADVHRALSRLRSVLESELPEAT